MVYGPVMKETRGRANPQVALKLVIRGAERAYGRKVADGDEGPDADGADRRGQPHRTGRTRYRPQGKVSVATKDWPCSCPRAYRAIACLYALPR